MYFISTGVLLSIIIATVSSQIVDDGSACSPDDFFLAAFKDTDCQCQDQNFIRSEGGTACANVAPANSFPTCTGASGGKSSQCGYQCKPGFSDDGKGGCAQGITCDPPLKPSADGKSCVAARQNVTMSEFDCSSDAGSVQYLSADPNAGCTCKDSADGNCSDSASNSDPDAEMICSDTSDMGGNRHVACALKCTDAFIATDPKTCGPREAEGETVTLAGTATPNTGEVACTNKVYKLSGKGGCKCDTSTPQGATECTAGQNAYPVCAYEKGSGDEADCGIACVPGKNLFGNKCR
ncbi:hypothetical protein C8R47DRAFT_1170952 [Mycena vitilis]|nr:hypothetical protein C8R47DRAFT_1170952 [Mycena vitilis]